jgi:hypothetical protein
MVLKIEFEKISLEIIKSLSSIFYDINKYFCIRSMLWNAYLSLKYKSFIS